MSDDAHIINATVWILAPHFRHPAISGGDVYILGVATGLSYKYARVELVGADAQHSIRLGRITAATTVGSQMRSKWLASVRTLLFRSSYQRERFVTKKYLAVVKRLVIHNGDLVFVSFIASHSVLQCMDVPSCERFILTHNFDPDYFDLMANSTRNPVARLVFRMSADYSLRQLKEMDGNVQLVHINEHDLSKYAGIANNVRHHLFEAGVLYDERRLNNFAQARKKDLAGMNAPVLGFVGSLWATQNVAGLMHFAEAYWPVIRATFPDVQLRVIGSSPGLVVKDLCQRNGWQLFPDLIQEDFDEAVAGCHFSILPFELSAGTKIKILSSLQCLVPVIGTRCSQPTGFHLPPTSLFSDDVADWVHHISAYISQVTQEESAGGLKAMLQAQSWQNKATSLVKTIHPSIQGKLNT
ncbi:MAG TPA: glycosyltransferase [Phnomibacter sp.]|nr:glycosyltransferase [Phnomibacter sp.]